MEWLKDAISSFFKADPNGSIDKDKLVSQFCIKFLSSERVPKEILKTFKNVGLIKMKGNDIYGIKNIQSKSGVGS